MTSSRILHTSPLNAKWGRPASQVESGQIPVYSPIARTNTLCIRFSLRNPLKSVSRRQVNRASQRTTHRPLYILLRWSNGHDNHNHVCGGHEPHARQQKQQQHRATTHISKLYICIAIMYNTATRQWYYTHATLHIIKPSSSTSTGPFWVQSNLTCTPFSMLISNTHESDSPLSKLQFILFCVSHCHPHLI